MSACILVVDDEGEIRASLERLLRKQGYEVHSAASTADAIRVLGHGRIDLAIVDLVLPGDGGLALLATIKSQFPGTETLMLSGTASIAEAVESVRAGAFDFVQKPFVWETLREKVSEALSHRKTAEMAALHRASEAIFGADDLDRLPETIVKVSREVLEADTATLFLPGVDQMLYVAHSYGLSTEVQRRARIVVGEGVAGRIAAAQKPAILQGDAKQLARFSDVPTRSHVRSSIVYPLVSGRRLLGMLTFNRIHSTKAFRDSDIDVASVLASQTMLALETSRMARQSATSERLAAVGQLAAGIAHEINTPIQFVGDSIHFLKQSLEDLGALIGRYEGLAAAYEGEGSMDEAFESVAAFREEIDLDGLIAEIPKAIERTQDGVRRVVEIVRAVKQFGRADAKERVATNVNQQLLATLTVAMSEFKYVADVETDLGDLPAVVGHPGELGQVFLNLIVNAAHAIADVVKQSGEKGKITIRTRHQGDTVEISISDTGCGIPADVKPRVWDPFYTTKEVGRGTGLGLAIARSAIVDSHKGSLTFESEVGRGTAFLIVLPIHPPA